MTLSRNTRALVLGLFASLLLATAQAEMTANVGGRLQVDLAEYNEDGQVLGSGTEVRRARFFVEGNLDENWQYKVQIDFADDDLSLKDAYLRRGWLTLGHFKVPMPLDDRTSSKYITFMERASVVEAFSSGRRLGAGADFTGRMWSASLAAYGQESGTQSTNLGQDEGYGVGGRFSLTPWTTESSLLHLGVWGAWEEPNDLFENAVAFAPRPESHVTGQRLVRAAVQEVDDLTKMGLEGALDLGSLSFQGEYIRTDVNRLSSSTGSDLDFDGYYVQASYLTGGAKRSYKDGSYGRTKASNVWEFAVRYSGLDLRADAGQIVGRGGEQTVIALGVNYYYNPYLRFMVNYLDMEATGYNNGDADTSPSALQFRVAMDFK